LAAIAQNPALGVQDGSGPEDSELMKPEFPVKRIFYYFADLLNPVSQHIAKGGRGDFSASEGALRRGRATLSKRAILDSAKSNYVSFSSPM
jgi:hypothetical protein